MIKIGKILKDLGLVTAADIQKALEKQKATGKFLGNILVEMGKISETDLLKCLSDQMHIGFISLKNHTVPPDVIGRLPVKYAWHYKVMPVKYEKDVLTVAVSDQIGR